MKILIHPEMDIYCAEKVRNFISQYNHYENDIKYVLENTRYITKLEVIQQTRTLINKWKQERQPDREVLILLESEKIGSQHWLYLECIDLLPDHSIIYCNESKIYCNESKTNYDNKEILIIDDWSITGENLIGLIQDFTCKAKGKYSLVCIIPFASDNILRNNNIRVNCLHRRLEDEILADIIRQGTKRIPCLSGNQNLIEEFKSDHVYFMDVVADLMEFPDINNLIVKYMNRHMIGLKLYRFEELKSFNIENLCSNFIDEHLDAVGECFISIHSEYKVPDSVAFRKVLRLCRNPVDRDFMEQVRVKFLQLHPQTKCE